MRSYDNLIVITMTHNSQTQSTNKCILTNNNLQKLKSDFHLLNIMLCKDTFNPLAWIKMLLC